tara:strand:- start:123 stop:1082 length:960 start_codon:yes stop_codon:yes gene_type:complete
MEQSNNNKNANTLAQENAKKLEEELFKPQIDSKGNLVNKAIKVQYNSYGTFLINLANRITCWRAQTFLTQEPTTLEWLQQFKKESWLLDIGANIGIYSVPAALYHATKVISVEVEPSNYAELLKNIKINKINPEKIEAVLLGISTKYANKLNKLYLTTDDVGQSCHQLGANVDHMLRPTSHENRPFKTVYSISLSQLIEASSIPDNVPLHIKIDVDGIECDICDSLFLSGLINRLSSIQVELNPINIPEHNELKNRFINNNFTYSEDQVERMREKEGKFINFSNYIFIPKICPNIEGKELSKEIREQHFILHKFYNLKI